MFCELSRQPESTPTALVSVLAICQKLYSPFQPAKALKLSVWYAESIPDAAPKLSREVDGMNAE